MPTTLYHYTFTEYLPSIKKRGLIPGYKKGPYGNQPVIDWLWLDSKRFKIRTRGWALLSIDTTYLDSSKLKQYGYWHTYAGTIPPEALTLVSSLPK